MTDERVVRQLTDSLAEELGELGDEAVATREAVAVVELLEVVDVDVQTRRVAGVGEARVDLVRLPGRPESGLSERSSSARRSADAMRATSSSTSNGFAM